ncbi:MAG: DNA-directed RNA polymerase subunit A'' [Nanopusillaceae archaeon]|jgi:DNA-directed RNA polymerase subunit A"
MELPKKIKEEIEKRNDEELKKLAEKFYEKMLIDPGEPAGIVAAQSVAEPTTQMILRSFHFVGIASSQVSLGLPRIIEITDARKKIKQKYMIIRLLDEYKDNLEVAQRVAKEIKEVVLEDLISEVYLDIFENKITIVIDENKLKTEEITLNELLRILKKKVKKYKIENNENEIYIIAEKAKPRELYLLKENLKKILIKGIKGIKDVTIQKEGEEYVIYTTGSNLLEIMRIPEVDYTKVYTNDIREIEKVLGIEAAGNAILQELAKLYEQQGLNIDIRHFILVADVLTWHGTYLGINRYGLHAEKESTLSKAAFETPVPIFMRASMIGETDEVLSGIDNVTINQPIFLGTGLYNVYYVGGKKEENKE